MKTTKSSTIFKQATKYLVGGVNSPVRAFNAVGGNPLVMQRGNGAKMYDVDGNAYTDYCMAWGALILGHNHPDIRKAAALSISLGSSFGTTTAPEVDIAQFICKHVPSVEKIRFVNSGTEAAMSAIRLARAFTGRPKVLKFDGCYHGHVDALLASAGSGVSSLPASTSQGIPASSLADTLSIPYNDEEELAQVIERHHREIACVALEPVAGNMGVIVANRQFLKTLRQLTKKYGILLVFDEVMSGFRSGLACAQGTLDVIPDITILGKIIGGGYPVGAYGGRADVMNHLAPLGKTYQAGTFAGNPIVMRAGLAALKNLTPTVYRLLNDNSNAFVAKTNAALKDAGIGAHLANFASMVSIRFQAGPVLDYSQAQIAAHDDTYAGLFHHLLRQGIYWPPANLETFFISTKHSQKDLQVLGNHIVNYIKTLKVI